MLTLSEWSVVAFAICAACLLIALGLVFHVLDHPNDIKARRLLIIATVQMWGCAAALLCAVILTFAAGA